MAASSPKGLSGAMFPRTGDASGCVNATFLGGREVLDGGARWQETGGAMPVAPLAFHGAGFSRAAVEVPRMAAVLV